MLEREVCNEERYQYHAIETRLTENTRPGSGSKTLFSCQFCPENQKNSVKIPLIFSVSHPDFFTDRDQTFFPCFGSTVDSDGFRIFHRSGL